MLTYPQWLRAQERRERWRRAYRIIGDICLITISIALFAGSIAAIREAVGMAQGVWR